jgi:TonB family protein
MNVKLSALLLTTLSFCAAAAPQTQSGKSSTSPAILIYKPDPAYTPKARRAKLQGTVTLWIKVDAQGNVTEARETSTRLGKGLDEKAIESAKTWKFKPATRRGVPVPTHLFVQVTFRLLQ